MGHVQRPLEKPKEFSPPRRRAALRSFAKNAGPEKKFNFIFLCMSWRLPGIGCADTRDKKESGVLAVNAWFISMSYPFCFTALKKPSINAR
jgi:hypothetical protein